MRRGFWLGALLVIGAASRVPAGGMEGCGVVDSALSTSGATVTATFLPYRQGTVLQHLTARDVQFQWDPLYSASLTPSTQAVLNAFLQTIVFTNGLSPVAANAKNLQAVYDYTHQEPSDANWNPDNPLDDYAFRVGYGGDNPPVGGNNLDRSHVDTYITSPDRLLAGAPLPDGNAPSDFQTDDEDLDTGHLTPGDVLPANSIMVKGPHPAVVGDASSTGWTGPNAVQRIRFNHELQHAYAWFSANANQGWEGEFRSAVAEAAGGIGGPTCHGSEQGLRPGFVARWRLDRVRVGFIPE